jgi:hypothetical protein
MTKVTKSKQPDPAVLQAVDDLLDGLALAIETKREADDDLAASTVKRVSERAAEDEVTARKALFDFLEANGLQNASGHGWMMSVVVRHGYEITDERAMADFLMDQGLYERFRTFDVQKVKKFASEFRLSTKTDLPGIASTEARFPTVRKVES